jgi:hypothetical protein
VAGFARGESEDWILVVEPHVHFPVPPGLNPPEDSDPPPPDPEEKKDTSGPSGIVKPNVPDIAQRPMECAPTSAANSLIYLSKRHGFGLPGERDLIEHLKDLMDWSMGVYADSFLAGKQALDLPIETEAQINHHGQIPSLQFIVDALKRCEDVELFLYFDAGHGHAVTISGYSIGPNGKTYLLLNDPDDGYNGPVPYKVGYRGQYLTLLDYPLSNWVGCAFAERFESPSACPDWLESNICECIELLGRGSREEYIRDGCYDDMYREFRSCEDDFLEQELEIYAGSHVAGLKYRQCARAIQRYLIGLSLQKKRAIVDLFWDYFTGKL